MKEREDFSETVAMDWTNSLSLSKNSSLFFPLRCLRAQPTGYAMKKICKMPHSPSWGFSYLHQHTQRYSYAIEKRWKCHRFSWHFLPVMPRIIFSYQDLSTHSRLVKALRHIFVAAGTNSMRYGPENSLVFSPRSLAVRVSPPQLTSLRDSQKSGTTTTF